jgi:hypothetical protein
MPKISRLPLVVVILAAALCRSVSQDQQRSFEALLPREGIIEGWSQVDSAGVYKGKDLYLFIDGGADLFLEYGFRQARASEYRNAGGQSLNLEMYEMNDPAGSYGIYSIRSGDKAAPIAIGQGGRLHPYYIMFWKGRYYVSVAASDSTRECRSGLEAVARAVDGNMHGEGRIPDIVNLFPREYLLRSGCFRGYLGLSSIPRFELKDLFHMIDGAFGIYGDHTLIFLRYNKAAEARERLEEISNDLKSDDRFKDFQRADLITSVADLQNRTLCFGQSGPYIIMSVSSKESVALASCKRGVSLLRAH